VNICWSFYRLYHTSYLNTLSETTKRTACVNCNWYIPTEKQDRKYLKIYLFTKIKTSEILLVSNHRLNFENAGKKCFTDPSNEDLLSHCEGLRSAFPKIGTKSAAHSLFISLISHENSHRSRTRLHTNACENCPHPPSYVQLGTLTH
jgi:hypothetical protein